MDSQLTMTLDNIIAQPIVTLDDLRAKVGALVHILYQEQKLSVQPYKSNTLPPPLKTDVKDKNAEIDNRNKDTK